MARRNASRNYWLESDPDFNRNFKRRWFENPPLVAKGDKVRIAKKNTEPTRKTPKL